MRARIVSLFIFSLFTGCSSWSQTIVHLEKGQFPPTNPENVLVLATKTPPFEYAEIGMVRVAVFRRKVYEIAPLKQLAAQYGADAVIDLKLNDNFMSGVAIRKKP